MEFSLSFKMIKTRIMSPFKAHGNFLEIESNWRLIRLDVMLFQSELSGEKDLKIDSRNHPPG